MLVTVGTKSLDTSYQLRILSIGIVYFHALYAIQGGALPSS